MRKLTSMFITLIVIISAFAAIIPRDVSGGSQESPDRQPVRFYMYGSSNNGNLTTDAPTSDNDKEADCPDGGNMVGQSSNVGTWRTPAFTRRANLSGNVEVFIWAKGDVRNVQFSVSISVNGNGGTTIQTNQNDTESTPKLFYGSGNINMHLNAGDRIEISITYDGGETNPIEAQNRHAKVVYGSKDHPSGIKGPIDSVYFDYSEGDIEVHDENADEDKETIIVTSTIYDALGIYDITEMGFKAETKGYEGETYDYKILENDSSHVKIQWKWRYGNDHAPSGGYDLNVTAKDNAGNMWWKTQNIKIVTQLRPKIDFVLTDNDIIVSPNPIYEKKTGYINATVHCYGEEGKKGLMPDVVFTIKTPYGTTDTIYRTPSIDTNSERIVSVRYYFNTTGTYNITVVVNPKGGQSYDETNDAGNADQNNKGSITVNVIKPPKKSEEKEWYEEIIDEPLYIGGISVAVIAAIVVVAVVLLRRGKDEEEYEEEEE